MVNYKKLKKYCSINGTKVVHVNSRFISLEMCHVKNMDTKMTNNVKKILYLCNIM